MKSTRTRRSIITAGLALATAPAAAKLPFPHIEPRAVGSLRGNATVPGAAGAQAQFCQGFYTTGNSTGDVIEAGNDFEFTLPNAVGAGNCLVWKITYPNGGAPTGLTDTESNPWSTTPDSVVSGGAGNNDTAIYVLPNAQAGVTTFTIHFATDQQPVYWSMQEWSGIATSPVNGTAGTANQVYDGTTPIATGSFTPGDNDANGGNLILGFFDFSGGGQATSNPSSFTPSSGSTLLHGDIAWNGANNGLPKAATYQIQATRAAVNPGISPNDDTADQYNCVAIALKLLPGAGTPPPSGIRIVSITEQFSHTQPATWTLQFPTTGNLRVFATTFTDNDITINSVTDSEGNTWTEEAAAGCPHLFFLPGATPNRDLIVYVNCAADTPRACGALYDIIGAAPSPLGAVATNMAQVDGLTSLPHMPDITPLSSNSLIIGLAAIGLGPLVGMSLPTGAFWCSVNYPCQSFNDDYVSADGYAHLYNTDLNTKNFTWTNTPNPLEFVGALAVEFKAAPTLGGAGSSTL
jgi:hypothetical protein